MKFLSLHVDHIKFKPLKKAIKKIQDLTDKEKEGGESKEALVILTAVEKVDKNVDEVVKEFVKHVKDIAGQVKAKNIVLYPYAHLSSNLASPEVATEVLDKADKTLRKDFKVVQAPFGYYKEFEMKVKGHPLSELSGEINVGGKEEVEKEGDSKQLLREISKTKLDTSKLKDNDHRILGQQMDLFSFNETAPGMVFWHNNGLVIRDELINFWKGVHQNAGYLQVSTPQILDKRLWQISGHWEKYRDNIFLTEYEKRTFVVKPMNCPGGILIYKNKPKSYKDLPLKVGELGIVHRQELSGVLGGLFRVIQFTQDDAHIYCNEKQVEAEIGKIMDLVDLFYSKFSFKYEVELSTRPEKRIGSDKLWDKAEKALQKVLNNRKIKYKLNKGEGAFYGPKIDFHLKDSLGRTWQCGTIQVDFSMPERFELEYTDKDNKKKKPVMIHRTIYGSLERFIGVLLEHYNGRLPTWLAPVQVKVLSLTDRNELYVNKVARQLQDEIDCLRVECDIRQITVPSKVKDAELMKIPYIILIGDKEEKDGTLAVRVRGDKAIKNMKFKDFVEDLKEEIEDRI